MTTPGQQPTVTTARVSLPPEWVTLMRLLAAAAASDPGWEQPARDWLDAYRVKRCGCGTAVVAGGRCRGCGKTVL